MYQPLPYYHLIYNNVYMLICVAYFCYIPPCIMGETVGIATFQYLLLLFGVKGVRGEGFGKRSLMGSVRVM